MRNKGIAVAFLVALAASAAVLRAESPLSVVVQGAGLRGSLSPAPALMGADQIQLSIPAGHIAKSQEGRTVTAFRFIALSRRAGGELLVFAVSERPKGDCQVIGTTAPGELIPIASYEFTEGSEFAVAEMRAFGIEPYQVTVSRQQAAKQ